MRSLIASLLVMIFAVPSASCFDDVAGPDFEPEISILFIGNSLTMANDLTGMVAALLDSAGVGPTYVWEQTAARFADGLDGGDRRGVMGDSRARRISLRG